MASGQPLAACDSAARRRRERRLRSWPRHERMTVAMALAEKLHHSAQRPMMARAWEEGHEDKYNAPRRGGRAAGTTGTGPAAPRGGPWYSCAAGWEPAGGDVPAARYSHSRTGYRSAQDLIFIPSFLQASGAPTAASWTWTFQFLVVGGRGGLQGFRPGQDSTAPHSCEERTSERIVEQIVDIPVSGGGLQDFRPGQSSSWRMATCLAGGCGYVPVIKQRRLSVPGLSCPSLCNDRCRDMVYGWAGFIIMCQSTKAFGKILILRFARAVRSWKLVHFSSTTLHLAASPWCLGVACGIQIIGFFGRWLCRNAVDMESTTVFTLGRISHNFYVVADSNPEVLLSFLLQNGEACPVDASSCSFALRSSHQGTWSFFHESHEAGGSDDDRVSSSHRWWAQLVSVTDFASLFLVDIHGHQAASRTKTTTINTIWGGSVLTGEELPPHSGELKHALPQAGGPNPIPAIPPYVVRTPHLHGAPTTEETVKLWYQCQQ